MSDVDENETEVGAEGAGNAPKVLREQNSKLTAELAEARELLNKFQQKERANTIADVLRSKEANPKLAKHIARDLEGDVTEEAVAKWLEEEGDAFGYQPPSPEDLEAAQQQERISSASANAPQPPTGGITVESLKGMTHQQMIDRGFVNPT